MAIDLKLIDKLLADYKKPEEIIGENGLLKQLTKAVLERAMQVEMTESPRGERTALYVQRIEVTRTVAEVLRRHAKLKHQRQRKIRQRSAFRIPDLTVAFDPLV